MQSAWPLFLLAATAALAPAARANESDVGGATLRLNGFATVVATRAFTGGQADYRTANYLGSGSDRSRTWDLQNDSIFGLQFNASAPGLPLTFAAQGVVASTPRDELAPRLDWLFVGWQVNETLALRAGRTPFPAMMDSEVRWVGHARLTVSPPPEAYFHLPMTALDGAALKIRHDFGERYLLARFGIGQTDLETAARTGVTEVRLRDIVAGSVELGDTSWRAYIGSFGGRAQVVSPPLTALHDALDSLSAIAPVAGQMAAAYPTAPFRITQVSLGFEWLDAPWSIKTEAVRRGSDTLLVYAVRGWYGVLGYTRGRVTPYLTGGRQWQASDLSPKTLPPGTPGGATLSALYNATLVGLAQTRIGAGVRIDLPHGVALKAQVERFRFDDANSRGSFVNATPGFVGRADPVDVFSLAVDVQF